MLVVGRRPFMQFRFCRIVFGAGFLFVGLLSDEACTRTWVEATLYPDTNVKGKDVVFSVRRLIVVGL
jgi:hypothetical protein